MGNRETRGNMIKCPEEVKMEHIERRLKQERRFKPEGVKFIERRSGVDRRKKTE